MSKVKGMNIKMMKVNEFMTEKKKNIYILGFFFIVVFFLRIFYITRVKGPFVYADEMGYWGHAANLSGNTWSGVMNGMPWYAYGYSLLLVPIFYITTDIVSMYRIAIVLNALLGILSFGLVYKIIRKMKIDSINVTEAAVIAFTVTSFSSYIFCSYIAWSETLLSCLIWLILYEIILLEESPKYWRGVLLGTVVGYGYMVHNRMLAVVAAVLLTLIYLLCIKKIKTQHLLCVIGAIAVIFFIDSVMKNVLSDLLGNNAVLREMNINAGFQKANSLSEQILKFGELLTLDGFKKFMLNAAGQIWQMLSATYLLAGLGFVFCIGKMCEAIKKKDNISLYLFPMMAVFFTILMTSLFFIDTSYDIKSDKVRIDTLFYGRYNDILVGMLILMALLCLFTHMQMKIYSRYILAICCVYLAFSFIMYYNLKGIENSYLNLVSAASIYIFHWLGEFSVWKCVLIVLLANVVCLLCYFIKMPKQIRCYLISFLFVFLFSTTALKCMRLSIRGENDYTQQYTEIFDYLNENTEAEESVFTLADGKFAYDLQTRLVNKPVISIDIDQMNFVNNSQYIVMSEQDYSNFANPEYVKCLQTKGYVIIQKSEDY